MEEDSDYENDYDLEEYNYGSEYDEDYKYKCGIRETTVANMEREERRNAGIGGVVPGKRRISHTPLHADLVHKDSPPPPPLFCPPPSPPF